MSSDRSRPGPGPAARPPASRVRGHAGPVGHRRGQGAGGGRRDPRGRPRGAPLRGGLLQEGRGVQRCGAGAGGGGGRGGGGQQRGGPLREAIRDRRADGRGYCQNIRHQRTGSVLGERKEKSSQMCCGELYFISKALSDPVGVVYKIYFL